MTDGERADAVVIERTFDAPVDQVWKMWTDPDHFRPGTDPAVPRSRSPRSTCASAAPDVCAWRCRHRTAPMQMWFIGKYLEVVETQRLVYTEAMADEHGKRARRQRRWAADGHPMTTEVRVELAGAATARRW